MLVMNGTNVNYSASSQTESGDQLASMSASYSGDSINFGLTIYKDDEAVDTDFIDFKDKVTALVASIKG